MAADIEWGSLWILMREIFKKAGRNVSELSDTWIRHYKLLPAGSAKRPTTLEGLNRVGMLWHLEKCTWDEIFPFERYPVREPDQNVTLSLEELNTHEQRFLYECIDRHSTRSCRATLWDANEGELQYLVEELGYAPMEAWFALGRVAPSQEVGFMNTILESFEAVYPKTGFESDTKSPSSTSGIECYLSVGIMQGLPVWDSKDKEILYQEINTDYYQHLIDFLRRPS